jgi:hypothetical protein
MDQVARTDQLIFRGDCLLLLLLLRSSLSFRVKISERIEASTQVGDVHAPEGVRRRRVLRTPESIVRTLRVS